MNVYFLLVYAKSNKPNYGEMSLLFAMKINQNYVRAQKSRGGSSCPELNGVSLKYLNYRVPYISLEKRSFNYYIYVQST